TLPACQCLPFGFLALLLSATEARAPAWLGCNPFCFHFFQISGGRGKASLLPAHRASVVVLLHSYRLPQILLAPRAALRLLRARRPGVGTGWAFHAATSSSVATGAFRCGSIL